MSEIPEDVMQDAQRRAGGEFAYPEVTKAIACAIMDERERCARRYAYEAMRTSLGKDLASSIRFDGMLVITHPDMPPHVWDGEKMTKLEIGIDLSEQPASPTDHASTSPGPVNCSIRLRHQGKIYPRTCERCGLGPCPFFHKDGTAK